MVKMDNAEKSRSFEKPFGLIMNSFLYYKLTKWHFYYAIHIYTAFYFYKDRKKIKFIYLK